MIARYDLSRELISFDFYSWLVMARARGATDVVFGTKTYRKTNWSARECRRRFETIIAKGPTLAGMGASEGDGGDHVTEIALRFKHFVAWSRLNQIDRLESPAVNGSHEYTVTLRRQAEKPHRNSNDAAWRKFAREIGALVIEDFDDRPIDLLDRMAIYAGARMNYGVVCGPLHVVSLTDYPLTMLKLGANARFAVDSGIPAGSRMPWLADHHVVLWEDDTYDNIRRCWEQMRGKERQCA